MQQPSTLFNDEQKKKVAEAVALAESKTSAEIVPVVAASSGRYDRPEDVVGLWMALLFLVCTWLTFLCFRAEPADEWGFSWLSLELPALIAAVVLGFVVGAVVGTRVGWLRRLFTPRSQMHDEVAARARSLFFDNRVHHTEAGTGILVYVSLFEHMASVVGDEAVLEHLGQDALDALRTLLTEKLKEGDPIEAICATICSAGDRLAEPLPRKEGDVNELPDALVILDD
jgi:putative membrane protein